jgi:hypothetical protein
VRLHGGTVDEHLRRRTACARQRMEEIDPYALRGPADEPVIERLVRPVDGRCIDPAPARLQHLNDAADYPSIIDPRLA